MKSLERYRPLLDILVYAAFIFIMWLISKYVIDRFTDDLHTGFTYLMWSGFGVIGAIGYIIYRINKRKKPKES